MSSFFEQELQKLFGDGHIIGNPTCLGQTCLGTLDSDLRVRAEFVSTHTPGEYNALRLTVLNRAGGPVDTVTLNLEDLLGRKALSDRPDLPEGIRPFILKREEKTEWYSFQPTAADYKAIQRAAEQYLDVFREQSRKHTQDGPRMVYICAPLRGDVKKNIAFARQKAQEVFQAGDIPVCPHLMFPPIADPEDPVQDQAAREMGLRLVESCQQVNVYGTTLSEGMWAEINHAVLLNIPVKSDLKALDHASPSRHAAQKPKRKQHER